MATKRLIGVLSSGSLAVTLGVVFSSPVCASEDANTAFVFIKPHANTAAAQALVKRTLAKNHITIKAEGELTAAQIDQGLLIDQRALRSHSRALLRGTPHLERTPLRGLSRALLRGTPNQTQAHPPPPPQITMQ